MIPKTREQARCGKREKPHYFLTEKSKIFFPVGTFADYDLDEIESFESRIDWSTWGR